jgi:hypothetical protein
MEERNMKKMKCFYCERETTVDSKTKNVICSICVLKGLNIKDDEERQKFFRFMREPSIRENSNETPIRTFIR